MEGESTDNQCNEVHGTQDVFQPSVELSNTLPILSENIPSTDSSDQSKDALADSLLPQSTHQVGNIVTISKCEESPDISLSVKAGKEVGNEKVLDISSSVTIPSTSIIETDKKCEDRHVNTSEATSTNGLPKETTPEQLLTLMLSTLQESEDALPDPILADSLNQLMTLMALYETSSDESKASITLSAVVPDPSASLPDLSAALPDSSAVLPDSSALLPDSSAVLPDLSEALPDPSAALPEPSAALSDPSAALPDPSAPLVQSLDPLLAASVVPGKVPHNQFLQSPIPSTGSWTHQSSKELLERSSLISRSEVTLNMDSVAQSNCCLVALERVKNAVCVSFSQLKRAGCCIFAWSAEVLL